MAVVRRPTQNQVLSELRRHRVRFVSKADSRLMRVVGWLMHKLGGPTDFDRMVTVVRFPFRAPVIYTPVNKDWTRIDYRTWWHELHHIDNMAPWYGPLAVGIRYMTSAGRLKEEIPAYARDIRTGRKTLDDAANILKTKYMISEPLQEIRNRLAKAAA